MAAKGATGVIHSHTTECNCALGDFLGHSQKVATKTHPLSESHRKIVKANRRRNTHVITPPFAPFVEGVQIVQTNTKPAPQLHSLSHYARLIVPS